MEIILTINTLVTMLMVKRTGLASIYSLMEKDTKENLKMICFHGNGTYYYLDGTVNEGLWKEGEFIGE